MGFFIIPHSLILFGTRLHIFAHHQNIFKMSPLRVSACKISRHARVDLQLYCVTENAHLTQGPYFDAKLLRKKNIIIIQPFKPY